MVIWDLFHWLYVVYLSIMSSTPLVARGGWEVGALFEIEVKSDFKLVSNSNRRVSSESEAVYTEVDETPFPPHFLESVRVCLIGSGQS